MEENKVIEFPTKDKSSNIFVPAIFKNAGKEFVLTFEFKRPDEKQEKLYLKNSNRSFKPLENNQIEIHTGSNGEVNKTLLKALLVTIHGIKGADTEKLLGFCSKYPDLLSIVLSRLFLNFSIEHTKLEKAEEDLVLESLGEGTETINGAYSVFTMETDNVEIIKVTHTFSTPTDIDRLGYLARTAAVIDTKIQSFSKSEDLDFAGKLYDKLNVSKTGYPDNYVPLYHKVQNIEALFSTVQLKNAL